jgi:SAM-dependent methyltransferase
MFRTLNRARLKLASRLRNALGLPDYQSEVDWWDTNLPPGARHEWMLRMLDREQRQAEFPKLLLPFVEEAAAISRPVQVLDVGSGPLSPLCWGVDRKLFVATAVDPLARDYARLLERRHIDFPIRPVEGTGEDLRRLFSADQFDIVYSRNALDHAMDVRRCIEGAAEVLRDGGVLYLEGFVREGTHEGWQGLHQNDLVPEGGALIHYDRRGKRTSLTEHLDLTCLAEEKTGDEPGCWYILVLRKGSRRTQLRSGTASSAPPSSGRTRTVS